jgi:dUTP pyrophosphatase
MSRYFEVVNDRCRKTTGEITLPKRATAKSAAYDIYSPVDVTIEPNTSYLIWTDVKVCCNDNEVFIINVRSSMGKQPMMLANTQGWIDSDYFSNPDNDGNIGVNLRNLGNTPYIIQAGDRIAQGMFINYLVTDDDNTTAERLGGFGSTGTK